MTDNKDKGFTYSYSADEQEEIRSIRARYVPKEPDASDKMEQLRRLDGSVTRKGTVISLVLGIIGALGLGLGMSLALTDLGGAMGAAAMPIGICVGIVGIILVSLAYPMYNVVTERERERIAPVILKLTDELIDK